MTFLSLKPEIPANLWEKFQPFILEIRAILEQELQTRADLEVILR